MRIGRRLKICVSILLVFVVFISAFPQSAQAAETNIPKVKLVVVNQSKTNFHLILTGEQKYDFMVKGPKSRFQLASGSYNYTHNACGVRVYGYLVLTEKSTTLTIPQCPAGYGPKATIKIDNRTGGMLTISLVQIKGLNVYNFTIAADRVQEIQVVAAAYKFTVTGCGGKPKSGKVALINTSNKYSWLFECRK